MARHDVHCVRTQVRRKRQRANSTTNHFELLQFSSTASLIVRSLLTDQKLTNPCIFYHLQVQKRIISKTLSTLRYHTKIQVMFRKYTNKVTSTSNRIWPILPCVWLLSYSRQEETVWCESGTWLRWTLSRVIQWHFEGSSFTLIALKECVTFN